MSGIIKVFEFTADQARKLALEQSVAGEPMTIGEVTIIPISKISCGFSGGGWDMPAKKKADGITAGAGTKVKKTPLSFLAVCGKEVKVFKVDADSGEGKGSILDKLKPLLATMQEKSKEKKAAKAAEKEELEAAKAAAKAAGEAVEGVVPLEEG